MTSGLAIIIIFLKFCPFLKRNWKIKEDQDKDAYSPQRNFSLSHRLLYKAPSYVNATFLCRVAKIVHIPRKETSPCLIDFWTKRHNMSTRHFFDALPKYSWSPMNAYMPQRNLEALNLMLLVLSGHVCNHHTPRMLLFLYSRTFGLSILRYWY